MTMPGRRPSPFTRAATWGGVALALGAALGLAAYLMTAGLDDADKLASVLGALAGLAGLVLALFGIMSGNRGSSGEGTGERDVSMSISSGSIGQSVQAQQIDNITFGAGSTSAVQPRIEGAETPRPD